MKLDDQLILAKQIAEKIHNGQRRTIGRREDYIEHPKRMADRFSTTESKIVALLHDVLENSDLTGEDLIAEGISVELVYAIKDLTRTQDESYLDYILRVKNNYQSKIVKIADIRDNLGKLREGSLRDKYLMALYILEEKNDKD